jgi:hypothetical protein
VLRVQPTNQGKKEKVHSFMEYKFNMKDIFPDTGDPKLTKLTTPCLCRDKGKYPSTL